LQLYFAKVLYKSYYYNIIAVKNCQAAGGKIAQLFTAFYYINR